MVVRGEPGDRGAEGRAGGEVERPGVQLAGPVEDLIVTQLDHRQRRGRGRWLDDLAGQAVLVDEPGAQPLVPHHEGVQGPLQRGQVQLAVDPQRDRHAVGGQVRGEPVHEPHALLLEGAGHRLLPRHGYQRERPVPLRPLAFQQRLQSGDLVVEVGGRRRLRCL